MPNPRRLKLPSPRAMTAAIAMTAGTVAVVAAETPSDQSAPENSARTIAVPKGVTRDPIAAAGVHRTMRRPQGRENRVVTPLAIHVTEGGAVHAVASEATGLHAMHSRWISWPTQR